MLLVIGAAGGLISSVCFFVDETQYVYVVEFGKPVRLHTEAGLKFKLPYQAVRRFDRRLQIVNPPGSPMLTQDRAGADKTGGSQSLGGPSLSIEWYATWRLPSVEFAIARIGQQAGSSLGQPTREEIQKELEASVLRFIRSVGTSTGVHDRLRERIDSRLKAEVGRMSLSQFVNKDEPNKIELEALTDRLTKEMRETAFEQFGIEVVDVRIKRFNHPEGVKPAIFEMIRTERQGVAEKYRAQGKSEAAMIRSSADTQREQLLSKAAAEAERIRGQGEAEAMRIANEAHSKDPQFYQLLKTLETYRTILNEKTTVVLSADSNLLRLFTEGMPKMSNADQRPAAQATDRPSGAAAPASDGTAGNGPRLPGSESPTPRRNREERP